MGNEFEKESQVNMNEITHIHSEVPTYQQAQAAQIDTQITTAKAYPRDLRRCVDNAIVIVTMSKDTAASCGYELPRAGKKIKGPTVHLAAILAQSYGNFRAEYRVSEVSQNYVTAEAVAFDLETNFALKAEVRRKILDRNGRRYNEDMINTTGLAAAAIAYRNAVLRVIPRSITDKVYNAALDTITGDLSDEQKLLKARTQWIKHFKNKHGATEAEILEYCGVKAEAGIKAEEIKSLVGLEQSFKDGDTTPDQAFGRIQGTKPPKTNTQDLSDDKPVDQKTPEPGKLM